MSDRIESTDDARRENSPVRHQSRVLSDEEKAAIAAIKDKGEELFELIKAQGLSREVDIAMIKTEEAVMWAVKHVTA